MSDLIRWVMIRAAVRYDPINDGTFNAANFSEVWKDVTGIQSGLDGHTVRAMLYGRDDVIPLPGGSHFRLIATPDDTGNPEQ